MAKDPEKGRGQSQSKEPFVGEGDRPQVRLDPDMPISELRVRDLTAILGRIIPKRWKGELKEFKEHKEVKLEKNEKLEFEKLDKHPGFENVPDFGDLFDPRPDPFRQVVEVVTGLNQRVEQLADQVAKLQEQVKR